ncbi:hypothetical protein C6Q35_23990 [Burkholderia multivorans]|nr:hypothetical protein C6Q35_23990 [Burkholderia multivorans]
MRAATCHVCMSLAPLPSISSATHAKMDQILFSTGIHSAHHLTHFLRSATMTASDFHFFSHRTQFLENYFEKKYCVSRHAIRTDIIRWADLDTALFSWDPSDGLVRLYQNDPIPIDRYTEQFFDVGLTRTRIIKEIFYGLLKDGATLILNRLDMKSPAIYALTMEIARFVEEKAVSNGYVAFGGNGTFSKHWDTHDVFAVQLIGRKRWRVFEPTVAIPMPHQTSKQRKAECPTEPVFDDILEAGDILYLPRGWWHEAIPLQGEETFHVAVGIHTIKFADYAAWSCVRAATDDIECRRSIRLNACNSSLLQVAKRAIVEAILDTENFEVFKRSIIDLDRTNSEFNLELFADMKKTLAFNAEYCANSPYSGDQLDSNSVINGITLHVPDDKKSVITGISSSTDRVGKDASTTTSNHSVDLARDLLFMDVIRRTPFKFILYQNRTTL